jgi:release factor glutamine methyltransferase
MSAAPPTQEISRTGSSNRVWTVLELLRWTAEHFASRGIESARLDAECLLAHALGTSRIALYLDFEKPVGEEERAPFRELVRRRADERVPVALLTGHKEFWSLDFEVTRDVLVPRPETETLVELALRQVQAPEAQLDVLDLGTGSGAIAIALATELPNARFTATDLSAAALEVARRNAETHGVTDRIRFLAGDAFEPVAEERFDLVLSNPPYVAQGEAPQLAPELLHEPSAALFSGGDGTDLLARLAREVAARLADDGFMAFEVGAEQAERVAAWLSEAGLAGVSIHRDAAGQPRVVSASRRQQVVAAAQLGGSV